MTIPEISPYPMPAELPANRVPWRPDPDRAVLLVHDMQNYFVDHFDRTAPPVPEAVENIRALRAKSGLPVIYTAQPGGQTPAQRGLQLDMWGPGIGTEPAEEHIVSELTPGPADTVLTKWRYNAFLDTELASFLNELGRDQLVITGVYAHIGCLMTAAHAFMTGVQAFLVADAVADFSAEHHEMALRYVAGRSGVVMTTRDVLAALEPQMSPAALRCDVADVLDSPADGISDHANLFELGLDSVRLMNLVERWHRRGTDVSVADLAEHPTLAEWWRLLSRTA